MNKKILFSTIFVLILSANIAIANKVNPSIQDEIKYYEKLKNCIPAKINNGSIMFQTYGKNGRMCSFEMKEKDPLTNKFISNCRVLAPIDATKAFADRKIQFVTKLSQIVDSKTNKPDTNAMMNEMNYILDYLKYANTFAEQYCQK